ncbi:MAG: enoyl-[acyl-carrier-protein] reductase FabV [Erysipelothrix sp.]|nr:enoyl-[acyl-carrier-protein] reductase FabV [Erysipelothrix sp.]
MKLKPMVRDNIALNAHEEGCKQSILNQIEELKNLPSIQSNELNVLIIGGSSGYGLASRIALTFKANAYTYNVSFERAARGRNTASAGYYNNEAFQEIATSQGYSSDDLNADAFSHETKQSVIEDFTTKNIKIDLLIYSVASGIRFDPDTQEKYVSALKPIGKEFKGQSVDIAKELIKDEIIQPANDEEIFNTTKVMGGEDYLLWVEALNKANLFNEGATTLTYTYVGSELTYPIYKDGTIGHAKRNLESTLPKIQSIMDQYNGHAKISSSKTVVTKASVFIPTVALYASALFKVMKERGTHESITEHKYRLFKDFIFNKDNTDSLIRLDAFELDKDTQVQVETLLDTYNNDLSKVDFEFFKEEFMRLSGFEVSGTNY